MVKNQITLSIETIKIILNALQFENGYVVPSNRKKNLENVIEIFKDMLEEIQNQ